MEIKEKLLTPQQEAFLAEYTNPKSPNFGNALQSAIKAGYSQTYSENITDAMPEWLLENIGDMKRLRKAEKNLEEVQNIQIYNEEGKLDANLIDKRTKVDMFIAERLNKDKYSTRQEQTGKDGKDLIPDTLTKEEKDKLLNLLNDKAGTK